MKPQPPKPPPPRKIHQGREYPGDRVFIVGFTFVAAILIAMVISVECTRQDQCHYIEDPGPYTCERTKN